jgi:serine/threonine-protein kinase PknK
MPSPGPSRAKPAASGTPSAAASLGLPPRYELLHELGRGGGGEVWAVRDRSSPTQRTLALKLLAADASEAAALALVREATALSGLEGLGVPRVVAFGILGPAGGGRRYFVRELADGNSLDQVLGEAGGNAGTVPWVEPFARAAEQLTALHRAGMFHGDVKPANIIVGEGGAATLVDLGLATPWREGGGILRGLTPKYAAPELFLGEPLTVRAEVFALGATLLEAIERRGHELPGAIAKTLSAIGRRATEKNASARYPSAAELASAVRHAAGLPESARFWTGWPVLGLDMVSQAPAGSPGHSGSSAGTC